MKFHKSQSESKSETVSELLVQFRSYIYTWMFLLSQNRAGDMQDVFLLLLSLENPI